jgi:hypothetical protein
MIEVNGKISRSGKLSKDMTLIHAAIPKKIHALLAKRAAKEGHTLSSLVRHLLTVAVAKDAKLPSDK